MNGASLGHALRQVESQVEECPRRRRERLVREQAFELAAVEGPAEHRTVWITRPNPPLQDGLAGELGVGPAQEDGLLVRRVVAHTQTDPAVQIEGAHPGFTGDLFGRRVEQLALPRLDLSPQHVDVIGVKEEV